MAMQEIYRKFHVLATYRQHASSRRQATPFSGRSASRTVDRRRNQKVGPGDRDGGPADRRRSVAPPLRPWNPTLSEALFSMERFIVLCMVEDL
jgi:hypothetical protein